MFLQCPLRAQRLSIYTTRRDMPSLRVGWDEMGRGIKSVLQFSSYFVGIQIMFIPTYTFDKKLLPTFLWVLKFDVKLGFGEHNFRNYTRYVSFQIFGSKSCLFFSRGQWCFENSSIFLKISNFQVYSRQVTFLLLGLKVHFLSGWGA